jgi:hypothetical protein
MASATIAPPSRASAPSVPVDCTRIDDLTKSEAEILLDRLEAAGIGDVEVCCTKDELFALKIPGGSRS